MKENANYAKSKLIIGAFFWILVFAAFFAMIGCGSTRKKTEITDTSKITDTTLYKKTIVSKDSSIVIPGATLKVSVPAAQLDNGQPVETKTDRGRVILQKNGENIEAVCMIDDLVKVIQLQNTIIENHQKIESLKTKTENTSVVKDSFWNSFFASIGFILLPVTVLQSIVLIWMIRKKITT